MINLHLQASTGRCFGSSISLGYARILESPNLALPSGTLQERHVEARMVPSMPRMVSGGTTLGTRRLMSGMHMGLMTCHSNDPRMVRQCVWGDRTIGYCNEPCKEVLLF